MKYKLICCNVFMREACYCIAQSPHMIDVEFTELGEHAHSATLRNTLQNHINATEESGKPYDAILLLFGICGNSTVGLTSARIPLVIPRAHDCCSILLGSKQRFKELFEEAPSTPFSSVGYMERGDYFLRMADDSASVQYGDSYQAYVEQYGEEAAQYIWESMHPKHETEEFKSAVFIDIPETAHLQMADKFRDKVVEEGKEYIRLEGNIQLIKNLILGNWNEAEFLIVPPKYKISGVYDYETILEALPVEEN